MSLHFTLDAPNKMGKIPSLLPWCRRCMWYVWHLDQRTQQCSGGMRDICEWALKKIKFMSCRPEKTCLVSCTEESERDELLAEEWKDIKWDTSGLIKIILIYEKLPSFVMSKWIIFFFLFHSFSLSHFFIQHIFLQYLLHFFRTIEAVDGGKKRIKNLKLTYMYLVLLMCIGWI